MPERLYKGMDRFHTTRTITNRVRVLPSLDTCAATVAYSIPSAGVHRRSGEQVSGTSRPLRSCTGRGRIRFLGSVSRDCSRSSSRVVYRPSLAVPGTAAVIAIFFDRSPPTSSSTTSPLQRLWRLHLQPISTCDVI